MNNYLELMKKIIDEGVKKEDRTGVGTLSIFGYQLRFDLSKGFPLVTTKKIHLKSVIHELLWILSGSTNVKYLNDNGVTIWNEWANKYGNLGPVYGEQWRNWLYYDYDPWSNFSSREIDQISILENELKTNPNSRRLIINSWNVGQLSEMALLPCHVMCQFNVANNTLSCHMYQRSADVFLGVPFNIASYALLTVMLAKVHNFDLGDLVISFGDAHLYLNHLEQAKEQLTRTPHELPKMNILRKPKSILDFKYEDFEIENYTYHPKIVAPVAV